MTVDLPPVEAVYEISEEEQKKKLIDHFDLLYVVVSGPKLVEKASFEIVGDLKRGLSGISEPYLNAVIGSPKNKDYTKEIQTQLSFFKKHQMPFVWYVTENENPEFEKALLEHGFKGPALLQGVLGPLEKEMPEPSPKEGVIMELVKDEETMREFNQLVADTFGYKNENIEKFCSAMWQATQVPFEKAFHWVAKKDGKIVSALTTIIDGDVVSFWNGATHPDHRRCGYSTELRKFALKDAVTTGCTYGASYLMPDGMALGICQKLGYEPKWRFHVYMSPE